MSRTKMWDRRAARHKIKYTSKSASKSRCRAKSKLSPESKKRLRVAAVFVICCFCSLATLMLISKSQEAKNQMSALEYLVLDEPNQDADPLKIADAQQICLVGVTQDGKTIGYQSNLPAKNVSAILVNRLKARGWILDDTSSQWMMSMSIREACLFIQCMDVSGGSSMLVRMI